MNGKYLIVIDMQNDFCTGSLKNDDAVTVIPKIKALIEKMRIDSKIVYTRDTHYNNYLETTEGKYLPVKHCVYGTPGWEIVDELKPKEYDIKINKPTFGYKAWAASPIENGDEIHLVGVCTDICVISNALILKATFPDSKVIVHRNCCAGLTREKHEHALDVMSSCQCEIVD